MAASHASDSEASSSSVVSNASTLSMTKYSYRKIGLELALKLLEVVGQYVGDLQLALVACLPILDDRNTTAVLGAELASSALGQRIF